MMNANQQFVQGMNQSAIAVAVALDSENRTGDRQRDAKGADPCQDQELRVEKESQQDKNRQGLRSESVVLLAALGQIPMQTACIGTRWI